jgi:tellurium resistance protein TerZ
VAVSTGRDVEKNHVKIHVLGAKDLLAADFGGTSDPYVKIKDVAGLAGNGAQTRVIKKTLNPTWDELFPFDFSYKLNMLRFKVFDYDIIGEHDIIGKCTVPISALYDGREHDMWVPLWIKRHGTPQTKGQLHLKLIASWMIPIAHIGMWLPIPIPVVKIGLGWDFSKKKPAVDLDASVLVLDAPNKVLGNANFRNLKAMGGLVVHHGDNRTGEGSGDDETITVNLGGMPPEACKVVVAVNSFTGTPLSAARSAYLRLHDGVRTIAFMRLGEISATTGLFFGYLLRTTAGWFFQTVAKGVKGKTVTDSIPEIIPLMQALCPPK